MEPAAEHELKAPKAEEPLPEIPLVRPPGRRDFLLMTAFAAPSLALMYLAQFADNAGYAVALGMLGLPLAGAMGLAGAVVTVRFWFNYSQLMKERGSLSALPFIFLSLFNLPALWLLVSLLTLL